ncbi:hypothetical protein SUGI_0104850 [Cryptomeria japonica]|nr:hypothetical protein SUGI_0104850 [Cryptomeria japonica]
MKRGLEEGEDGEEGKRGRREGVDIDVEELFAVLKRIEATKKQLGCISMADKKKPFPAATAEAVSSKTPWRLSFEWEDFCCSNGNRSRDLSHASASVVKKANFKQGNRLKDDDNKQWFVCLHQSINGDEATEKLDLNLPATPAGFHLFL